MRRRAILTWAILPCLFLGAGRALAAEPGDEDLRGEIEALRRRVAEQDRRLGEMERELRALRGEGEAPASAIEREVDAYLARKDAQEAAEHPRDLRASWVDGIRFDSRDGAFRLRLGGLFMVDATWAGGRDLEKATGLALEDGAEFRRVRLYLDGTFHEHLAYKMQLAFEGGDVKLKGVYLEFRDVPVVGSVRIGSFKEPLYTEEIGSASDMLFVERGLPDALSPRSNVGILLHDAVLGERRRERLTWAIGVFRETDLYGTGRADGHPQATARVTGLPWLTDEGDLLHLGLSVSLRSPSEEVRYRERPEAHLLPYVVDTGPFEASRVVLLGLEAALVRGPLTVKAEMVAARADTDREDGLRDPSFLGWTAQVGYVLTGERRPYQHTRGLVGAVVPARPFRENGGRGSLEIAARLSQLDLDGGGIEGGRLRDATLGLSWRPVSSVRVMANWIHAWLLDVSEEADVLVLRLLAEF